MTWLEGRLARWLDEHIESEYAPTIDPRNFYESIRAGDVVLVAGRTRMSRFVKLLSGSSWTHVALCLGRIEDYSENADRALRSLIAGAAHGNPREPVLIEALLGRGTILSPLSHYRSHAIKICRPQNLSERELNQVIRFAVRHLGFDYDLRLVVDLARLALPIPSFLRRWRSTVFETDRRNSKRCICSTLLVQAFASVAYPVVAAPAPHSYEVQKTSLAVNPRLATPRDFDESPYFKYLAFPSSNSPAGRVQYLPQKVSTSESTTRARHREAPMCQRK
jgi:hypothetical protein